MTTYSYNLHNQVTGNVVNGVNATYTYAKTGALLSESNGVYDTAYAYDDLGRNTTVWERPSDSHG